MFRLSLEDLLKTIETLRGRIEEHGTALRKSEAQTRYALVDPLLRGLGWDTSDPTQVVPEYRTQTGPADYSLLDREGEPALMLEAKKLGRALSDGLIQSIGYCVDKGTRFFAVTDGQHWEVYETHKPVPTNEKLVAKFDLKTSPSEVCLKALTLWRPSVEAGNVREGQTPVVEAAEPAIAPPKSPEPPKAPAEAGWIPLAGQRPEQGALKPVEVLCPTGARLPVKNWHGLRRQIVKWLVESGHLAPADAKDPEYHQNSANEVKRAEANIKQAKLNPADFKVRLAD